MNAILCLKIRQIFVSSLTLALTFPAHGRPPMKVWGKNYKIQKAVKPYVAPAICKDLEFARDPENQKKLNQQFSIAYALMTGVPWVRVVFHNAIVWSGVKLAGNSSHIMT